MTSPSSLYKRACTDVQWFQAHQLPERKEKRSAIYQDFPSWSLRGDSSVPEETSFLAVSKPDHRRRRRSLCAKTVGWADLAAPNFDAGMGIIFHLAFLISRFPLSCFFHLRHLSLGLHFLLSNILHMISVCCCMSRTPMLLLYRFTALPFLFRVQVARFSVYKLWFWCESPVDLGDVDTLVNYTIGAVHLPAYSGSEHCVYLCFHCMYLCMLLYVCMRMGYNYSGIVASCDRHCAWGCFGGWLAAETGFFLLKRCSDLSNSVKDEFHQLAWKKANLYGFCIFFKIASDA